MEDKKRKVPGGTNQLNQVDSNTKMLVLSMLTTRPQDRFTLSRAIGIHERTFRQAVHDLRREGHLIISDSDGRGYRLGTRKEAAAVAREMRSRAYDMLKTAARMEGNLEGQIDYLGILEAKDEID